jgi:trehalose 6-phosphate phosphatase
MRGAERHLPAPERNWALFLDFDGTLTELAPSPDAISIDPRLRDILLALEAALGGALAIVSGRPLSQIDEYLGLSLPGAGIHGLQLRETRNGILHPPPKGGAVAAIAALLAPMVEADPRLLLEEKPGAVALHYRLAPEREVECRATVTAALEGQPGLHLIDGKMVLEVKPDHVNKGRAIAQLMETALFQGRIPVFAGDDRTDEDGFRIVNAMKGVTIKVGQGETGAAHRIASVDALLSWLGGVARSLSGAGRK